MVDKPKAMAIFANLKLGTTLYDHLRPDKSTSPK